MGCGIFSCSNANSWLQTRDQPQPPALEVCRLSHWNTIFFFNIILINKDCSANAIVLEFREGLYRESI